MRSLLLGTVLALSSFTVGCAAAPEESAGETAAAPQALDTSGCSGLDLTRDVGPVTVAAARPPRASCWNIGESGLTVSYDYASASAAPADIGFWVSLNGAGTYAKATGRSCRAATSGGFGHDTGGEVRFVCTASVTFAFGGQPAMLGAAYGAGGERREWSVEVAVSLDDDGHWDSLGGRNYRVGL